MSKRAIAIDQAKPSFHRIEVSTDPHGPSISLTDHEIIKTAANSEQAQLPKDSDTDSLPRTRTGPEEEMAWNGATPSARTNPTGEDESEERVYPSFEEFIELFAHIRDNPHLFPKPCRVCGRSYRSFAEYLCATKSKGHGLEDCSDVMKKPFTMVYRHCVCGNTLVMTLTLETFPALERFWSMVRREAKESNRPTKEVVSQFAEECTDAILVQDNPCQRKSPG